MLQVSPSTKSIRSGLGIHRRQKSGVGIVTVDGNQLEAAPNRIAAGRGHGEGERIDDVRLYGRGHAIHGDRAEIAVGIVAAVAILTVPVEGCAGITRGRVSTIGQPQQSGK